MEPISKIGLGKPTQAAIITGNIEHAVRQWAALLGCETPEITTGGVYEVTHTEYMGKPAPQALAKLAFFNFDSIQLELIEPFGEDSTWKDFLTESGGGIHHFGFQVDDMEDAMKKCEAFGMKLTQKGNYNDGSGMYAYFDGREQVNCFVELLHSFR